MKIRVDLEGRGGERDFLLIAHRGGGGFGPENTLRALRGALDFGVEMVETDVRMTGDGVPVIHHGPFVGLRLISRMTAAELKEAAPEVPTLREYLEEAAGRVSLNLEIKRCDPEVLADLLGEFSFPNPPLISSFDASFLAAFRRTAYRAPLGLLDQYEPAKDRLCRKALECGASVILPFFLAVDRELVAEAHREGLRVIAWTVNATTTLRSLLQWGVDGAITDDYPRLSSFLETEYYAAAALDAGSKALLEDLES